MSEFLVSSETIFMVGSGPPAEPPKLGLSGSGSGSLFKSWARLRCSLKAVAGLATPDDDNPCAAGRAPCLRGAVEYAAWSATVAALDLGLTLRDLTTLISSLNIDCKSPASSAAGRFCTW